MRKQGVLLMTVWHLPPTVLPSVRSTRGSDRNLTTHAPVLTDVN